MERGAGVVAERILKQIVGFSGFGFPKAHSAAFGLLAYQSAWLRVYYGPQFLCGLLNEQPMGFYPPDALVHEAQRRGVEVCRRVSPRSAARQPRRGTAPIRMGLGYVTGVKEAEVRAMVAERDGVGEAPPERSRERHSHGRRLALARRSGRAVGRVRGDARPAGVGGRVRRARRRRALLPPAAPRLDARRRRARHPGRGRGPSWRCRSIRTRGRSCGRSAPGSGCSPAPARPA